MEAETPTIGQLTILLIVNVISHQLDKVRWILSLIDKYTSEKEQSWIWFELDRAMAPEDKIWLKQSLAG